MRTHAKNIKDIQIRTFNYCMILAACLLYSIIIYKTFTISMEYNALILSSQNYIACEKNAASIREGSDYLTDQVRLCVVNLDMDYARAYFTEADVTRRRDNALEDLKHYSFNENITSSFHAALEKSNKLMEKEIYAMKLIATATAYKESALPKEIQDTVLTEQDRHLSSDAQIAMARNLVFNVNYQNDKAAIMRNIEASLTTIIKNTQDVHANSTAMLKKSLTEQYICIAILFILNTVIFVFISLLVVKPLGIFIERIKSGELFSISGTYEFKYLAKTYNNIFSINKFNEAMLRRRAEYDALTDVLNRGAFDRRCSLLRGDAVTMALVLVDVDHFKEINDNYGHDTGDRALQKVARLLCEGFLDPYRVARFGGDEFAVIMKDTMPEDYTFIQECVSGINQQLQHPVDDLPPLSISVGVAFSVHGYDENVLKRADEALYEVKKRHGCGCKAALLPTDEEGINLNTLRC